MSEVRGDGLEAGTAADNRDCALIGCAQGFGIGGIGAPRTAGWKHHVVRMPDPDRHVADQCDTGAMAAYCDGEQDDHAVL